LRILRGGPSGEASSRYTHPLMSLVGSRTDQGDGLPILNLRRTRTGLLPRNGPVSATAVWGQVRSSNRVHLRVRYTTDSCRGCCGAEDACPVPKTRHVVPRRRVTPACATDRRAMRGVLTSRAAARPLFVICESRELSSEPEGRISSRTPGPL